MPNTIYVGVTRWCAALVALALIIYYRSFRDVQAWIYFGLTTLHATLWLVKRRLVPEEPPRRKRWIGWAPIYFVACASFWSAPWLIVTNRADVPSHWYLGSCFALFVAGASLYLFRAAKAIKVPKPVLNVMAVLPFLALILGPDDGGDLLMIAASLMVAYHWFPLVWLVVITAATVIVRVIRWAGSLKPGDFSGFGC